MSLRRLTRPILGRAEQRRHTERLKQLLMAVVNASEAQSRESASSRLSRMVPGGGLYATRYYDASAAPTSSVAYWQSETDDVVELGSVIEALDQAEAELAAAIRRGAPSVELEGIQRRVDGLRDKEETLASQASDKRRNISLARGEEILKHADSLLGNLDDEDPAGGDGTP